MKWTQLKVNCAADDLECVIAVMSMLDNGLMIEDYRDIETTGFNAVYGELIDESLMNADRTKASVSLYVPEEKNVNEYISFIKDRFGILNIGYEYELIGVDEEDWANSWKQYYKPVKISDRLVIVPEWEVYEPTGNEITVKMDPGMAFGTGTHETTRLCARLIEKFMAPNARVLDIGTGSGILAVSASKLGASFVTACDIDPVSIRVAKENVILNNADNIECVESDLLKNVDCSKGQYDFVSANIVADIIIRLAPNVGNYLKTRGIIVTSGIINTQADEVKTVMENNGFKLADALDENDWIAFAFVKN